MRKFGFGILLLCLMVVVAGCSKGSDTSTNSSDAKATVAPTKVATPTAGGESTPTAKPVDLSTLPQPDTDYVTDEMMKNAIMAEGNLARLAAAMRKAQNGEEITVGVIGGSITQGSLASNPDNCYASRFYQWWVKAFPNAKVNFVNAGIGATTSYLGVHRVDKDLLSHKPDVVIVEFSVNDSDNIFYKETYEDLVRRILKAENNPAVILLFMTMEDGTSAQPSDLHIGFWYDLPRISYRQMVLKEMEKGTFTWKDISPDNIHPNDRGHAMVGEILWGYLNSVYAKLDTIKEEVKPLDKKPFFKEAYADATILDSASVEPKELGTFEKSNVYPQFNNDWTTTTGDGNIVFETDAQNIGIMFYKTTDGQSGQFDVYIDGQYNRTLDADFTGGWGNYAETVEVYRSGEKKTHTIEIKKSKDSTGDLFTILGLLIS